MQRLLVLLLVALAFVAVHGQEDESPVRCCYGDEGRPFSLSCPPGQIIESVDVASYGNPVGYCNAWSMGDCNADGRDVVTELCVGKSFCAFTPTDEMFGNATCNPSSNKLAAQWTCGGQLARQDTPLPATPPLSTSGRFIVDATGERIKLAGVNWYGGHCFEMVPDGLHVNHVRDIAREIRLAGFNVVRLQWSNEVVASNPVVEKQYVAANPQLVGMHVLDVYTAVVEALGLEGVFVVLDNHISDAGWCCLPSDGNGLWYNRNFTEEIFFQHWEYMVERHSNYSNVIAAELRNELRISCGNDDEDGNRMCRDATWDGPSDIAWKRASTTAGNRIHAVNPDLLIFISGLASSSRLRFVRDSPTFLDIPHKLVYVAHDYSWWHPEQLPSYEAYREDVENNWGYVATSDNATFWDAPLLVSEFGTCHDKMSCIEPAQGDKMEGGRWYSYLVQYLEEIDADFTVWAWNGSTCGGEGRTYGAEEGYGVANICWNGIAFDPYLQTLQRLQQPTLFPSST